MRHLGIAIPIVAAAAGLHLYGLVGMIAGAALGLLVMTSTGVPLGLTGGDGDGGWDGGDSGGGDGGGD